MKLKALSAAMLLIAGVGAAEAAPLSSGSTLGSPSSIVLAITDTNSVSANYAKTYLLDLGWSYADLANGVAASKSWDLSTLGYLFGTDTVTFNVTGTYGLDANGLTNFDKSGASGVAFTDPAAQWGLVTSGKTAAGFTTTDYNTLVGSAGVIGNAAGGFATNWVGNAVNTKLNGAQFTTVNALSPGNSFFADSLTGFGAGSGANPGANTILDGAQTTGHLFWITNTDTTGSSSVQGLVVDRGALVLSGSTLSFTSTAVPVPAAIWLLGSSLLGLVSIGRRDNKA